MEEFFILIKHRFRFLWKLIEWANGLLFSFFYEARLKVEIHSVFREFAEPPFLFRVLNLTDADGLYNLIHSQKTTDLKYFKPHGFDINAIRRQFSNPSFLMMGVFDGQKIVGYFFLRFFINRRSFVGRLIDQEYRGKGIGLVMNNIMYETSWRMGFRCLSTISRNNTAVMHAHSKNPTMIVQKELADNYLLVEFVKMKEES